MMGRRKGARETGSEPRAIYTLLYGGLRYLSFRQHITTAIAGCMAAVVVIKCLQAVASDAVLTHAG